MTISNIDKDPVIDCTDGQPDWQVIYDDFVGKIGALHVGATAPGEGDDFPPLTLPDGMGRFRDVIAMATAGPLVISFNRGSWCRYCRGEIENWRQALPLLERAGGRLVVISAEVGGRINALADMLDGKATILCDVDHGAALGMGLAFFAGSELLRHYHACGLDLTTLYGTANGLLPIPATYVIDGDGIIHFASVDPDFRHRAAPADAIAVVRRLTGTD